MFCGQADGLRELGVDVDRVEVAGRARVAVRDVLVGSHAQRRNLGAGLELGVCHQPPLTMLVQVPFTVVWPSWFLDSDSNT